MCDFFKLKQESLTENYIRIKEFPNSLNRKAILHSQFQYIDKSPITVEVSEESGVEYPDLLEQEGYVLLSNKLKSFVESEANTTCLFKQISILDKLMGKNEFYWLTIIDQINCLDPSSVYDDELSFKSLIKVVIDKKKVGYYDFFKIMEAGDNSICITKGLKNKIEDMNFKGLNIISL